MNKRNSKEPEKRHSELVSVGLTPAQFIAFSDLAEKLTFSVSATVRMAAIAGLEVLPSRFGIIEAKSAFDKMRHSENDNDKSNQ